MIGATAVFEMALPGRWERETEIRRQHRAWLRGGYDGHNRHGGLTTMDRLRARRRRRRMRRALHLWLQAYRAA